MLDTPDTDRPQQEARRILTGGEFPTSAQVHGLGELTFLFLRGQGREAMTLHHLRRAIEPATDTGQFAVMRQDGVPRAAISWAFLTEEAETRLIRNAPLSSQDWISGDRLWLMDLIAPYGQGSAAEMMRFWHASLKPHVTRYRCQRPGRRPGETRIFEGTRRANGRFGARRIFLTS